MRQSVKQRLILAFRREFEASTSTDERAQLQHNIWELGQRGSGPLPRWARSMAKERGIA